MTTVAIMQPTYLPWMGYFELMLRSDVFVFLDDVQFERKSWQSRQRLKGPNGPIWLRIPTKHGPQDQPICDVQIDNSQPWAEKHWRAIQQAYCKAPYWGHWRSVMEGIFLRQWERLASLTTQVIGTMMDDLRCGQRPYAHCATSLGLLPAVSKERHIIDICRAVGADTLYDAAGAEAILNPEPFQEAGITLRFQKYEHPVYRQLHGPFIPYMGVLDLLANEGPKAQELILSGGRS